ncbi:5-oxoprolinase subunit PxpB [Pedobacter hartonius]|uniref:Inhibitor of KinA n=1 Tax=Pedobacter hartonius TaxID=425514 RepID=A0A1H3XKR5_9SPHI|nr:5-oxoprolinase subunit PxpB [Pedobacter hartonius]SDZ99936.1 inhibitor of KinA [Pedobacter hartonius]
MNSTINDVRFYPLGDAAIVVQFDEEISNSTHEIIRAVCNYLEEYSFDGFIEYVPAFTTVTIFYEPIIVSYQSVQSDLEEMLIEVMAHPAKSVSGIVEIPVLYGGVWGPDLDFVAAHTKLTTEEVISIHTGTEYLVHMIGFAPGFPYLAGMDEQLSTPRRETPRSKVPPGSVGIAGKQTGVYPIETPAGWQIIGCTPIHLFDAGRAAPALLKAGDRVRFVSITETEFEMTNKRRYGN